MIKIEKVQEELRKGFSRCKVYQRENGTIFCKLDGISSPMFLGKTTELALKQAEILVKHK